MIRPSSSMKVSITSTQDVNDVGMSADNGNEADTPRMYILAVW